MGSKSISARLFYHHDQTSSQTTVAIVAGGTARPRGALRVAMEAERRHLEQSQADRLLGALIQPLQYVGEVFSLSYTKANVLIHDFHRKNVGGIPSLSFLVATRLTPGMPFDWREEDSSVILLRVMDAAALPDDSEAIRIRVQTAQSVSGTTDQHWDGQHAMDMRTNNFLSFAGVDCRVIGTFYLEPSGGSAGPGLRLRFGSDISNYYPNRGLKVYKPNDAALRAIVNYRDPDRTDLYVNRVVVVGDVRYASTNRGIQGSSNVQVELQPVDLLGQKSFLCGMTRTGKSNTTKIIIKSVYELRRLPGDQSLRVGQIVFDPNGEYANENVQDAAGQGRNPSAIKNIGELPANDPNGDIFTYGITVHPNDPSRRLMLLNFYEAANLDIGKTIIDGYLADDTTRYISNFRHVRFVEPDPNDRSATTRFNRCVLVYRTLLQRAGFLAPTNIIHSPRGLFSQEFINALDPSQGAAWTNAPQNRQTTPERTAAATALNNANASWDQLAQAFETVADFIGDQAFGAFNDWYMNRRPHASGDRWADSDLEKLLTMFEYPNGWRLIGRAQAHHTHTTGRDYAEEIYEHLTKGHLVIVDQSSGDLEINKSSADRIMRYIFGKSQDAFRNGRAPAEILIYVEEAHRVLPSGKEDDLQDIWVLTAKEGAKFHLGLVYATQEVSAIQKNILKNTANWFVGHLNNTDETKELVKFYDFADFDESIRRAQDRGFLRVKTLSNVFIVPVQVKKFEAHGHAV